MGGWVEPMLHPKLKKRQRAALSGAPRVLPTPAEESESRCCALFLPLPFEVNLTLAQKAFQVSYQQSLKF